MKKLLRSWFGTFAVTVLAVALLVFGSTGLGKRASEEDLQLAEQSIRRAAIQCYALEGFYPANIDYLQARYGVRTDDRLIIHYEYIASNLMPDITVVERR